MRVNIYAEEMTHRLEIISKKIDGHTYTGLRFYLALPASYYKSPDGNVHPVTPPGEGYTTINQHRGPFIHRPGDDESAAVTFWGKRELRVLIRSALRMLDDHYARYDATPTLGNDERINWDEHDSAKPQETKRE